jgi:L-glyceraldehyde 3-phosphate reductase
MHRRQVGSTDLVLSEVAFGCGGNAGLMVRGERAEQVRVVARALELGITYFDNAPDYGDGAAERHLGLVLKELGARPLLNSKVEIRAADLGDIAGHVVRSTEASLARLGVEQLDMLQIHNGPSLTPPQLAGPVYRQLWLEDFLRPGGACEGIERLLRAGKIRHAGFICRGDDIDAVCALMDTGLFRLINVPYTLLNPTAGIERARAPVGGKDFGNVLQEAQKRGVGAAIYSPLAGGFLTDDFLRGAARHPLARQVDAGADATQRAAARVATLRFLTEGGESLARAAFRFVLSHPGVTTVLGGFSSVGQVEELAGVSGLGPLPPQDMARLEALWQRGFEPA